METATTAKRTCSNQREEVRHDPISGELYDTGYVLPCIRPLLTTEDLDCGCCARCREELE